jgi:hypothetical protein
MEVPFGGVRPSGVRRPVRIGEDAEGRIERALFAADRRRLPASLARLAGLGGDVRAAFEAVRTNVKGTSSSSL